MEFEKLKTYYTEFEIEEMVDLLEEEIEDLEGIEKQDRDQDDQCSKRKDQDTQGATLDAQIKRIIQR